MAVDQIDRAITSRRFPPPVNQVGRGIRRVTQRPVALVRRIAVLAVALIRSVAAATPRALRSVIRAATGLVSMVVAVGLRIVRRATGTLRHTTAPAPHPARTVIVGPLDDRPAQAAPPAAPAPELIDTASTGEPVLGSMTDVTGTVEETAGALTDDTEALIPA